MKSALVFLLLSCLTAMAQNSWTNRHAAPIAYSDQGIAVAFDATGNTFVLSQDSDASFHFEFATLKYSPAGAPLWTNYFHGPAFNHDLPVGLVIDSSGNAIVAGTSYGIDNLPDFATIKYSNSGVPLWTNRFNPINKSSFAQAVAADTNGNAFVTGYSENVHFMDITTVKYASDGTPGWIRSYNGPRNLNDYPQAMTVDKDGNVLVVGSTPGTANGIDENYDIVVLKYTNDGTLAWTYQFSGPAGFNDQPSSVAVDNNGDVLVTGASSQNGGNSFKFTTLKLSGAGLPLWTNYYANFPFTTSKVIGVATDVHRDVYVAGTTGSIASPSIAVLKYSSNGTPVWTNTYAGLQNGATATGMSLDGNANVYVAGYEAASFQNDWVMLKLSGTGVPVSTNRYNGPDFRNDQASAIAVDTAGNAAVTGASATLTNRNCLTIRYAVPPLPAPLILTTTNSQPGGGNPTFAFDLSGPANLNAVLQISSNLLNWINIGTNNLGNGHFHFTDPQPGTNRMRFYRAQLLP